MDVVLIVNICSIFEIQIANQCQIGIRFLPSLWIDRVDHITVDTKDSA